MVETSLLTAVHTVRDQFYTGATNSPDAPIIHFFERDISRSELAEQASKLSHHFEKQGITRGDRIILCGQNDPTFLVTLLAAWNLGAIIVPVNPMYKSHEWQYILHDSGAKAIVCIAEVYDTVVADLLRASPGMEPLVLIYSADDDRLSPPLQLDTASHLPARVHEVLQRQNSVGSPRVELASNDIATICYTSGTTGKPKGAMNTHGNISSNAQVVANWVSLKQSEGILAIAPLFHITGLVMHAALAMATLAPLTLTHRFVPAEAVEAIKKHRPTFTIGSITAFILLGQSAGVLPTDLSSLTKLYSGGAAVPPGVASDLKTRLGLHIHNGYGLTETSSATHLVPLGEAPRVDEISGSMSIGVPTTSTSARILDENGESLPVRAIGELAIRGPQVTPGYWNMPEATSAALNQEEFLTGDIAFYDEAGWFYIVDRKKDMINASGFKVWPREVEDAIYLHEAVKEVAVVGVPDTYRGETVKAFVSLKAGATLNAKELESHCRAILASYKCPRQIEFVADLPKTASGKILRRELRNEG